MELTAEMQAYLDGYADGFARGFRDALLEERMKVPVVAVTTQGERVCITEAEEVTQTHLPHSSSL